MVRLVSTGFSDFPSKFLISDKKDMFPGSICAMSGVDSRSIWAWFVRVYIAPPIGSYTIIYGATVLIMCTEY